MDIKMRFMRWGQAIQDNPAILALAIIGTLVVVFIAAMVIDGFLHDRNRKKKKHKHRR